MTLKGLLFAFGVVSLVAVAAVTFSPRILTFGDGASPDSDFEVSGAQGVLGGDIGCAGALGDFDLDLNLTYHEQDLQNIQECLEPYETLVIVEGLPGVSGHYQSGGELVRLYREPGDELEEGLNWFGAATSVRSAFNDPGLCHVGRPDTPFQTTLTTTLVSRASDNPVQVVITIDAGVSGGLEPFVAVVRDSAAGTTHNYVPSLPRANAVINVISQGDGTGRGRATFTSTFHNNRDFFPYTGVQWEGDPIFNGTITIICG